MAPDEQISPPADDNATENGTGHVPSVWLVECAAQVPTAQELFRAIPGEGFIIYVVLFLCSLTTLCIYIDEVRFLVKNFKRKARTRATVWILAFFPVFSVTSFLGCVVPKSGTLSDMVANGFFGTCIYQFVGLMTNYMGGGMRMRAILGPDCHVSLRAPPCCCCCPCLGTFHFHRKTYFKLVLLVLQMAIVRPIIMFFAAVLWANGSYLPGLMSPYNGYTYITVVNLASTLPAMYGLMLLRNCLSPHLEEKFSITGKIASIQLTMLATVLPNVIISSLITSGVIGCTPLFHSKARGEVINHAVLVILMLPFSLIGRKFFRRVSDGSDIADGPPPEQFMDVENEFVVEDKRKVEEMVVMEQPVGYRGNNNAPETSPMMYPTN